MAASAASRSGILAAQVLEHGPQLQADQRERHRLEHERGDPPHGHVLQPGGEVRLAGMVAQVQAGHHDGQDPGHVQRVGGQVGGERGEERQGALHQRVTQPHPEPVDDDPEHQADDYPADADRRPGCPPR